MKINGIVIILCIFVLMTIYGVIYDCAGIYKEKTALEIKILQHELKAYEEMDKELAQ